MSRGTSGGAATNPDGTSSASAPAPVPVDVGIVAAMSIEVGFLMDRMKRVRKYAGPKHSVIEGECEGKVVALIVTGMGREAARRGAQLLLDGHRPRWILSAGFAGALDPALRRNEIVMASEVVDLEGQRYAIDVGVPPTALGPRVRSGRLLTVDAIVRTAVEKAELHARFGADVVDMETSSVASLCSERLVRFLSIRVVSDEAGIDLPPEVAALMTRSGSYQVGAALRAIWKRPSSLKDFWALHEHAQEAADRLATITAGAIADLP
ncbi:phosphorylase family protein [Singulisphaera acidiphila]|uniref:Nucleoside phosphorylase n=1 Tax=Singulisphaera acidiphila (strain ATCC BAA-1392 / DSM 18658 / VKM B-2454 / MOB10) TaxID=886293 RepID=L0DEK7_SINAD|nr:nucleoside phosphorylase [Singulisphaera acidiphila]AGA27253.1 nucleoside phosphorylase [Singulisphaera acidiphila DSM 18658]